MNTLQERINKRVDDLAKEFKETTSKRIAEIQLTHPEKAEEWVDYIESDKARIIIELSQWSSEG